MAAQLAYRTDIAVTGMSCASCARRVATALEAVPGVVAASVNPATDRATVTFDAPVADDVLVKAVEAAGYGAHPLTTIGDAPNAPPPPSPWPVIAAGVLTAPLLAPMIAQAWGQAIMLPVWLSLLLGGAVQFGLGARFYRAAWLGLRAGTGNMDQLVALGTSAAWALTLWNVATMGALARIFVEPATATVSFVLLGKWLEARAKRRTGDALAALAALRPATARLKTGVEERMVPTASLRPGDVVLVRPGERLPADGIVRAGRASMDEAMVTGESRPVEHGPDDTVTAGTTALDGALEIAVTALGADSTLGRIMRAVEDAQGTKAPVERLTDRVSAVFVPVVLVAAILTAAFWWISGGDAAQGLLSAMAVLVVACPCALGLATPTALVVGLGAAARRGILFRDPAALETASRIDLIAFDKTGTLTEGKPRLAEIVPADGTDASALLTLAGTVQQGSEHPLAAATLAALADHALTAAPSTGFRALPGIGAEAEVAGTAYALGTSRLLDGLDPGGLAARAEALEAAGHTLSWLVRRSPEPALLGLLAFTDTLRPGAAAAVAGLKAQGIAVALLTGDTAGSAAVVGRTCGIDDIHARLLPADKARLIGKWRAEGRRVAMVGDGINDAPALAAADLGIAVSSGTDIAVAAAQVTALAGEPMRVVEMISLARQTWRVIVQNLCWAFAFNIVGIPLAGCGLLRPTFAAAGMAASSLIVVANALRLGFSARSPARKARPPHPSARAASAMPL